MLEHIIVICANVTMFSTSSVALEMCLLDINREMCCSSFVLFQLCIQLCLFILRTAWALIVHYLELKEQNY